MTLPGFHTCDECGGTGEPFQIVDFSGGVHLACPECGGAGQVPDDDTVEVAASVLHDKGFRSVTRNMLLAYARHTQETKP